MKTIRPHQERWLPVVGYEGQYEVSDLGNVRSLDRVVQVRNRWGSITNKTIAGIILAQTPDKGSYSYGRLTVKLSKGGVAKTRLVHQLVAESFIGPRPVGCEVAHGDGNPANNCIDNLRYATSAENTADKFTHGTVLRGEGVGNSKLKEDDVRAIKNCTDLSVTNLAKLYGMSLGQVSRIRSGQRWGHVS